MKRLVLVVFALPGPLPFLAWWLGFERVSPLLFALLVVVALVVIGLQFIRNSSRASRMLSAGEIPLDGVTVGIEIPDRVPERAGSYGRVARGLQANLERRGARVSQATPLVSGDTHDFCITLDALDLFNFANADLRNPESFAHSVQFALRGRDHARQAGEAVVLSGELPNVGYSGDGHLALLGERVGKSITVRARHEGHVALQVS
jgi:hypothetical protein